LNPKIQEQISSQSTRLYNIDLPRFSRTSVAFLLQFIYGGLTCLPATIGKDNDAELLDPWELVELGAFTKVESFVKVVALHLRAVVILRTFQASRNFNQTI